VIMGIYNQGALCILDYSLRKVTAVALEDVSLEIITQTNLDKLIDTNPRLGAKLLKGMLLSIYFFLKISIPLIFDADKSKLQKREMYL